MKKIYLMLLILITQTSLTFSQNENDFKIGIIAEGATDEIRHPNAPNGFIVQKTFTGTNLYTSVLGVLEEDGVNLLRDYSIKHASKQQFKDWITLIGMHNMQMMTSDNSYAYRLSTLGYESHTNIWENGDANNYDAQHEGICHADQTDGYFLNYNSLFDEIYNVSPYKELIWGHIMVAENCKISKYYYYDNYNVPCPKTPPLYNRPPRWDNADAHMGIQMMPVIKAQDQFNYFNFKKSQGVNNNQVLINAPAHHSGWVEGGYDEDIVTMSHHGDVCFDAGYVMDQWRNMFENNWSDAAKYLSKFDNIDFEKKYFNDVYAEFDCARKLIEGTTAPPKDQAHKSSTLVAHPNFELIWFQTYTSIIHGVKGVVYYFLDEMFADPNDMQLQYDDDQRRARFYNHPGALSDPQERYLRSNFPTYYEKFLSHLLRELSYLSKNNFLSNDPKSILATKTNTLDPLGVVPPFSSYSHQKFDAYANDFNNTPNCKGLFGEYWDKNFLGYYEDIDFPWHLNENFGLRYTIRTNGEEVIMIITNPTPFFYKKIPLDFNKLSHSAITEATCVEVLFERNDVPINDYSYKTIRQSLSIEDLAANQLTTFYPIPIKDGKISIDFGAFDVHVLRFKREYPEINFNNEWFNIWSNEGNNTLGGWTMRDFDKYYPGDFDGDGDEEFLCIQHMPNSNKCWALLTEYKEGEWKWIWSNSGSGNIYTWNISSTDKFVVGDFNHSGRDQILIIGKEDDYADARIFSFENGIWDMIYTNSQNRGYIGGWDISATDKFMAAHFDANLGDQLLAIQANPNTNQNKVQLQKFNDLNDSWTSLFLTTGMIGTWTINSNDTYVYGDFDGDSRSELICHNIPNHINSRMYRFDGRVWVEKWNENSNPDITPYKSDFIVGDFNGDKIDEILGNDKVGNGWMSLFKYDITLRKFIWIWTSGTSEYLDDLYIKSLRQNTTFIPIKTDSRIGENLLAIREYSSENHLASFYAYAPTNNSVKSYLYSVQNDHYFYVPMLSKVTISTCSTETLFDTQILLYDEDGKYVAYNDNDPQCNISSPAYKASTIVYDLEPGIYKARVFGGNGYYRISFNIESIYKIPFNVSGNTILGNDRWDLQGDDTNDIAYRVYVTSEDLFNVTTDFPFTNFNTMFEIFNEDGSRTGYYNDDISSNNGNSQIRSATLRPGCYYFVVDGKNTDKGNFMLDVSPTFFTTKGSQEIITNDISDSKVLLYPNPSDGSFKISCEEEIKQIDIFNISGTLLLSSINPSNEFCYNVSDYPKGIYIVRVNFADQIKSLKLIIK